MAQSWESWTGKSPSETSLRLTVSFDHEIIDGASAARFTQRLKELIESGYGLEDGAVASEQAVAQESLLLG